MLYLLVLCVLLRIVVGMGWMGGSNDDNMWSVDISMLQWLAQCGLRVVTG